MHRLQSLALGIALGSAAFGGLIVGLTGTASASAAAAHRPLITRQSSVAR
jgi:F0F1-type ATP synthase membrane subunit c/vacuolar-type H+-ATPase subunit K